MDILLWIVFGAAVGWVASLLMRTDGQQGIVLNVIVGIVGAVIRGWIMNAVGQSGIVGFSVYSFLVALLGAVALLSIVRLVRRS